MDRKFWENRKVLVTGHTGFKGSWLCLWLQSMGAHVIGYSLPAPTKPSLFEIAHVSKDMTHITGDVRHLDQVQSTFARYQPEIVFHMAAQSLVRHSYEYPVETYSTNVMGTVNVLEAVRQSDSTCAVVIITSDKCYDNKEWVWGYRETERLGGNDPYSSSKGCAELVTSAYLHSYFSKTDDSDTSVAVATARAGNVIGGGDWAKDRLVPDIIKGFMENRPAVIRFPKAIRPWQHVLEPLRGYLTLAESLSHHQRQFSGAWNFGPRERDSKPVSWVADRLCDLWGNGAHWELDPNYHPHEAMSLRLDCSKAKTFLGWEPCVDLSTALQWIVDWYWAYLQRKSIRQAVQSEISRYEKAIERGDVA